VLVVDLGGIKIVGVITRDKVNLVTGQTVIKFVIVFVVTWLTGQFVTVRGQLVIVSTKVV
jgi:hypothetical protein